jgi:alkylhydroperoxidase family enzyme
MARIRLVPTEALDPALRGMAAQAVTHHQNPAIFQAMGHLPEAFKAYWEFYTPLRLGGLLDARLKELVRLKIAGLNELLLTKLKG